MKLTGAEILCESLTKLGVKHIFGYPGGAILPVYDALGNPSCIIFLSATNKAPHTWPTVTRALPAA